jgi:hypothetical protein
VKRWLILLLLVSLGLNAGLFYRLSSGSRSSEPGPGGARGSRSARGGADLGAVMGDSASWNRQVDHRLRDLVRRLDLQPPAAENFAHVHRAHARQIWRAGGELRDRRLALRDAMLAPDRDPPRIRLAVVRLTEAQARFDSLVAEAMLAELAALPRERQDQYLELVPWQRWGGGGGHGPRQHRRHRAP